MIRQIDVVLATTSSAVDHDLVGTLCRQLAVDVGVPIELWRGAGERGADVSLRDGHGLVVVADGVRGDAVRLLQSVEELDETRVAWVDLEGAGHSRSDVLSRTTVWNIRGRGLEGIRWAARTLVARAASHWVTESYGPTSDHVGDLRLPHGSSSPSPLVVLIHGGAWRERWERDLMDSLAVDLTRRGYATWNIEYRRVGPSAGGWPATFADVAAAIDHAATFADRYPIDLSRIALAGHSAGGHLAVWAAARARLAEDAPGGVPRVHPSLVVSLAGVLDLAEMARRGNEEGATAFLMGGLPDEVPDRYSSGSPAALLPIGGCTQLITYGTADRIDLVDNNRSYCRRASELGDDVDELVLAGADHFHVIDPRSLAWGLIVERIQQLFPVGATARAEPLNAA